MLCNISSSHVSKLELLLFRHHFIMNSCGAQVRYSWHRLRRFYSSSRQWKSWHMIRLVIDPLCLIKSLLLLDKLPLVFHFFDLFFGFLLNDFDLLSAALSKFSQACFLKSQCLFFLCFLSFLRSLPLHQTQLRRRWSFSRRLRVFSFGLPPSRLLTPDLFVLIF